jgi:hypothetical protein
MAYWVFPIAAAIVAAATTIATGTSAAIGEFFFLRS